jgi:hypothetical protein
MAHLRRGVEVDREHVQHVTQHALVAENRLRVKILTLPLKIIIYIYIYICKNRSKWGIQNAD